MGGGASKQTAKKPQEKQKQKPPPKKDITAQEKAILDLKNQRDKLHRYRKQIEQNVGRETQHAREALTAGNKQKALLFLKKKKYQESLLEKAEKQQDNLEEMVNAIEFASMEKEVFVRLKEGRDMLEAINKEMDVAEIEKMLDDTKEAIEYQNEISALLGSKLTDEDEDEVLQELAAIEQDESITVHDQLAKAPAVPATPLPKVDNAQHSAAAREEHQMLAA